MICRSKRVLGFQRKGHDRQTKLQWQGPAPHSDTRHGIAHTIVDSTEDDDAAMATADNVNWDQL